MVLPICNIALLLYKRSLRLKKNKECERRISKKNEDGFLAPDFFVILQAILRTDLLDSSNGFNKDFGPNRISDF